MKRNRFSEEKVIGILKEVAVGAVEVGLYRRYGMSGLCLYAWQAKYGGMEVNKAITSQRHKPHTIRIVYSYQSVAQLVDTVCHAGMQSQNPDEADVNARRDVQ